ncbi:MAG: HDOD domain-containing protein [Nitrospirae bacterium]|nr:HDOD domain-containing protein [Nitrospirota bacterium]
MQKKILAYIEKIPALSPTIAKIVSLTNNDSSSAADLVQVVKLDPTLTTKVLNLINSAYFGIQQKVTSINRAIILLGMNTIKNLALSAEVLSSFNPSHGPAFNVDKFWEHSLATAVACKLLSSVEVTDPAKREEFFIAGLIHDIGKIFLIKHFPRDYFHIAKKTTEFEKLIVKEKKFFSMDHAEIGALIAEKWALLPDLVKSIRYHHNKSGGNEKSPMVPVVYIANYHCKINGYDDDIAAMLKEPLTDTDWRRLGLTAQKGLEILETLSVKVDEAKAFLQVRNVTADETTKTMKADENG